MAGWQDAPVVDDAATAPAAAPAPAPVAAQPAWMSAPEVSAPPGMSGVPASAAPAQAAPQPTIMQTIGAGALRAVHDITDRPAELLARGADVLGLTGGALPTGAQTATADQAGLRGYEQQYGSSPLATVVRIGGDVGGALPILAAGGTLAGGLGSLAGAAVPAVAPALEGAGAFLSGTAGGGGSLGNLALRGASLAGAGAVQGGAGAALTAGSSGAPLADQMRAGAEGGAIIGPAAGALAGGLGAMGRVATGGGVSPEVAQLAQTARNDYNIPIYGGQISESPFVRFADSQLGKLPFSGAAPAIDAQATGFNRAVANTFGEDADRITPEVMSAARNRIGGVFNSVADKTDISPQATDQLLGALGKIQSEVTQTLPASEQIPVNAQLTNILQSAANNDGAISGQMYQTLTRKGAPLDRAMQAADPNVRYYAGQVRSALDDALQSSAAPEQLDQLKAARSQWRAMKTVEDLVEKAPTGNISPALLMGAVRSNSNNMAYTGGGALGDLARIGQQFLKSPPDSGTASRMAVTGGLAALGTALGTAGPAGAAALATKGLGALAAGRAAGSYLRSDFYTNRLLNSAINPSTRPGLGDLAPYIAPSVVTGWKAFTGKSQ